MHIVWLPEYAAGVTSELREPTFLVLAALARGRAHGYALLAAVESMSEGRVTLRPGTLYAVLDRLRDEGLAAVAGEEVIGGRLRRYYDLTEPGAVMLRLEVERMRGNAEQADRALRRRSPRAAEA